MDVDKIYSHAGRIQQRYGIYGMDHEEQADQQRDGQTGRKQLEPYGLKQRGTTERIN